MLKHLNGFSGFAMLDESPGQLASFKRKQQGHTTGREDLSRIHLDQGTILETQWSFPGCENEVQKVRESTSQFFGDTLEYFQLRQMMHDEDYSSHPELIKLRSMQLSYPGWEEDVDKNKRELNCFGALWKYILETNIQGMLIKQTVYDGYIRSLIRDTERTLASLKKETRPKPAPKANLYQNQWEKAGLKECVVCWEVPRTHVFVPCGHMCACKSCSERMGSDKRCPICNQTSTMSIEVFVP